MHKTTWSKYSKVYDPIKNGSIDGTDTGAHDKALVRAINSDYMPNREVKGQPENTLFVGNLNQKTTKEKINEHFAQFGPLKRYRLVRDVVTGFSKGYAFVEFENEADAEDAYQRAHKTELDGNILLIDFECERLLKGWKPRRLGGGFGGRKESGQLRFGGRNRPFKKPIHLELEEREEQRKARSHRSTSHHYSRRSRSRDRRFC